MYVKMLSPLSQGDWHVISSHYCCSYLHVIINSKAVDKNKVDAAHFAPFWNQIIKSLREEDYITDL